MTICRSTGRGRSAKRDVARPADERVLVEILVCGSPDRGDDRAPLAALETIADQLPDGVRVRAVGELDIDDLLALPPDAAVVVVDAAVGLRPGQVVELPLTGLVSRGRRVRARSSHSLAFAEVLALAGVLRRRPLRGRIVAIGGRDFGLGAPLSPLVRGALPALANGVVAAVAAVAPETVSKGAD